MYNILKKRRSIRKYKQEKVSAELVDTLIKAVLFSPAGHGKNPWEFIYIDDTKIMSELSTSKAHGAKFLEKTPQCLIVLADESKTDIWIEDASIATTIGHLTAESLGLGSCWIQIRNRMTEDGTSAEEYIKELLEIPEGIRVEAILAFGYPDEEKEGHPEENLGFNKVSKNKYGNLFFK